ncbi:Wzz/FepE/Etk N-terminal domain-containing protein [Streptomyces justiciae]|uniref:Wzz/FepE/Etk N-terminal domain-containing protein n=1 Tax=Streptomyces justiciae TaxID=2780140 RepID=UPI00187F7FE7|nr:Wzz/FepE/Etk N-terminal domain-containing protein [Streptomyces justiciae]MBE8474529.1 hypothetical protein [Streptomyces justiciae]MCW8378922.1 Wzz/FepE/Etk N-terminal domain-containing protein [Streptomyces justiciae]
MDVRAYLRLLRFHWVAIVLLTVLGAVSGALVAELQRPVYAARVEMLVTFVAPQQDSSEAYESALLAQERAKSYTTLLTSQSVLGQLGDELGLPYSAKELNSHVSASNPAGTAIIDLTVKDHSGSRALQIANGVAPVFARVVTSAENPAQSDSQDVGTPSIGVRTLDRAELLPGPVSPHKMFDVMLGLVVGLVLGIGWAVIRELSAGHIRDVEDLARATDADLLSVLPRGERPHRKGRRHQDQPSGAGADAYRWLALVLEAAGGGRVPHSFVLATATRGEETAKVAVGLAEALAESGTRVIVVDAGESGTDVARLLGLSTLWGLRDVLEHRATVEKALVSERGDLPVTILSGGSEQSGPSHLRKAEVDWLCGELDLRADVVIFAGPAVLEGSTGMMLCRAVGRAVLLVESRSTRSVQVTQSVQRLRSVSVTVVGTVLTGVKWHPNRPYLPAVAPMTRLDGNDSHRPAGATSRTKAWTSAKRAPSPLGPREEP